MTPEFQGTHLWDRLGWAKENLEPYRSEYCIVWEDPDNLDEPAKVTHPDPNWMACALNGGIPERVWKDYEQANRKRLLIVKKEQLPSHRTWRNAWKIDQQVA